MTEKFVSVHSVLGGGLLELFKIEGLFFVKSTVKGVVKFSEEVSKSKADYFVFDAVHHGCLEF